ncbi:MAG: hypothetical protein AB1352_03360 [Patescibacteria group bacterium]
MSDNAQQNSPVTLEDLAAMVKDGFDETSNRLSALEQEIKQRPTLEQIGLKLQNMENRLKTELADKPLERDRVLNNKTNTVAYKLGDKSIFTADDIREVERLSPVAVNPLT